jgi:hypothetical protein
VLLVLLACALGGCLKSDVCKSEQVAVSQADGGDFRCVVPEDCPRPSNVSICLTNTTPEKSCVRCQDTRCVETVITLCDSPEAPSP